MSSPNSIDPSDEAEFDRISSQYPFTEDIDEIDNYGADYQVDSGGPN